MRWLTSLEPRTCTEETEKIIKVIKTTSIPIQALHINVKSFDFFLVIHSVAGWFLTDGIKKLLRLMWQKQYFMRSIKLLDQIVSFFLVILLRWVGSSNQVDEMIIVHCWKSSTEANFGRTFKEALLEAQIWRKPYLEPSFLSITKSCSMCWMNRWWSVIDLWPIKISIIY